RKFSGPRSRSTEKPDRTEDRKTANTDAEGQQEWNGGEIGDQLWKNEDKDCTIVVGEKEMKAHKLILRSRSEVYKAMFVCH
uniref:BTB domain-containing protein n=1 Tax=Panagrolaimus sp. PS1159 TaxID=55785 RepID=A0AC35GEY6_9BILA